MKNGRTAYNDSEHDDISHAVGDDHLVADSGKTSGRKEICSGLSLEHQTVNKVAVEPSKNGDYRNGPDEEKCKIADSTCMRKDQPPSQDRSLFDIIKESFSSRVYKVDSQSNREADCVIVPPKNVRCGHSGPEKDELAESARNFCPDTPGPNESENPAEFTKIVAQAASSEWLRSNKQFPFTERLKRLSHESRQKEYWVGPAVGDSIPSRNKNAQDEIPRVMKPADIAVDGLTRPSSVRVPGRFASESSTMSVLQRNGQLTEPVAPLAHRTQCSVVSESYSVFGCNPAKSADSSCQVGTVLPRANAHSLAKNALSLGCGVDLPTPVSGGFKPRSHTSSVIRSAPTGITERRTTLDLDCGKIVAEVREQDSMPALPSGIPSPAVSIPGEADDPKLASSQESRRPSCNDASHESECEMLSCDFPSQNIMTCSLEGNRSRDEFVRSTSIEQDIETSAGSPDIPICSSCDLGIETKSNGNSSTTAMVRRLKPKLPSPSRDASVGDLYGDPSQLTREERALQRAMMRFDEMEMREKRPTANKGVKRDVRKLRNQYKKKLDGTSRNSGASTWLKTFKRKQQRLWISSKTPAKHNKIASLDPANQDISPRHRVTHGPGTRDALLSNQGLEGSGDLPQGHSSLGGQLMHPPRKKKVRLRTKEEKPPPTDLPGTHVIDNFGPKVEDKKRRMSRDGEMSVAKHARLSPPPSAPQSPEKDEIPASGRGGHSRSVKTYLLVASTPGFKDFEPVVLESRTRKKAKPSDKCEEDPRRAPVKPPRDLLQFPLLVVESVKSKPIKEMVIAESAQIKQMVENCLRARGKWHNLVSEEDFAEDVQDPESMKEAKKLTVNRTTGETILHKAARLGYDDTVRSYILHGADPGARDNAGWTPLHESCTRGKLGVAKVLTSFGADANACSNDGIRPVHDAAEGGHVEVLRLLLSHGADPMLATYSGNTALDCARDGRTKKFLTGYVQDADLLDSLRHSTPAQIGLLRLHHLGTVPFPIQTPWEFRGSCSVMDDHVSPDHVSGILDTLPEGGRVRDGELELSDQPHLPSFNLPVVVDDVVVSRRNYVLLRDVLERLDITRVALVKKMKKVHVRRMAWSDFLREIRANQMRGLPKSLPASSSSTEESVELIPITFSLRRMLGIRVESVSML